MPKLKWSKDGKLAEKATKTSVFLRPQVHTKIKARARAEGISISEYLARLAHRDIGAAA